MQFRHHGHPSIASKESKQSWWMEGNINNFENHHTQIHPGNRLHVYIPGYHKEWCCKVPLKVHPSLLQSRKWRDTMVGFPCFVCCSFCYPTRQAARTKMQRVRTKTMLSENMELDGKCLFRMARTDWTIHPQDRMLDTTKKIFVSTTCANFVCCLGCMQVVM